MGILEFFQSFSLSSINSLLLFSPTPETWVKAIYYIILSLASVGFCIVATLQIKSTLSKDKTPNKTFEGVWTIVPLVVLIALWWFS